MQRDPSDPNDHCIDDVLSTNILKSTCSEYCVPVSFNEAEDVVIENHSITDATLICKHSHHGNDKAYLAADGVSRRHNQSANVAEDDYNCNDPLIEYLKKTRIRFCKNVILTHINVNSLSKCREYVLEILISGYVDVFCVTESKLCDIYKDSEYNVNGYKMHRNDKTTNSGGMVVWLRADIPHKRRMDIEFSSHTPHIESMIFSLTVKTQIWYLVVVYKNPKVSDNVFLERLCCAYTRMSSDGKEIILLGDVNINMLQCKNKLKTDLCETFGLTNLITNPTCFKTPSGTLLDPVLVMNANRFQNPINQPFGYSDFHNLVGCVTKLHVPPQKPVTVLYRNFKNFDDIAFNADVARAPFHISEIFDDVNDKIWYVSNLYKDIINEHAPLKKRIIRTKQVPYMHSELRKNMYRRNMLKNKYFKHRSPETWQAYCKQRNITTKMRRSAIKSYFLSKCGSRATAKDFWNCIKPYMNEKSNHHKHIILNESNNIITDKGEICEIFNAFFTTVAEEIGEPDSLDISCENFLNAVFEKHKDHPSIYLINENISSINQEFDFVDATESEVRKIMSKIKPKKATGFDEIPPRLIKQSHENLSTILTEIINTGFDSCEFPLDMKKAEISPLFKKKDDTKKENYRPVSILSTFSKIFETVISEQLACYFEVIFNDMLCAYRKKYGCEHVLIKLIDSWKRALDQDKFVGAIFMDLSKAFDCVPHGLFICKLKAYGLSDRACLFMSSYLSGRMQRIKIENERSSWRPLTKGVPQGSCLGPLIFNIFINDLFYALEACNLTNYADDNTLDVVESAMHLVLHSLKIDTTNAIRWFTDNFMQANPEKFQFFLLRPISCKEDLPDQIVVNDITIMRQEHVSLLGITIDDKLKFDLHVGNLCSKASKQLNVLFRFKNAFNIQEKITIYQTFVLSNFNYCPVVWHFCSAALMKKIEYIQERAMRFIYNDFSSSYNELLLSHKYDTLHVRRIKSIASEVYKTVSSLNPDFMKDMITEKSNDIGLRDGQKLIQPEFKKIRYGRNTFSYYGPHIWNLLPIAIKASTSIEMFKRLLKTWDGPKCSCSACLVYA